MAITPIARSGIEQVHLSPADPPMRFSSQASWKTHAYVVVSYLLIGIGVALACASVYMATMFHPMLAATPIIPLAAGIMLLERTDGGRNVLNVHRAPVYIPGQPLGLRNNDITDCFTNVFMQGMCNIFAYRSLIEELTSNGTQTDMLSLYPLFSAVRIYQAEKEEGGMPISSVDTRRVRDCLLAIYNDQADKGDSSQKDFADLLVAFHDKTNRWPPIKEQLDDGTPKATKISAILLANEGDRKTFKERFAHFFHETVPETGQVFTRYFTESPRGFFVRAPIHGYSGAAVKQDIEIEYPMDLTLTKEQCRGSKHQYSPDYFVVHNGSMNAGHYICYVKTKGQWWEISDAYVSEKSEAEVEKAIRKAYFVHYGQSS